MNDVKRNKSIRINFNPMELDKVEKLRKYFGYSTIQEIIRHTLFEKASKIDYRMAVDKKPTIDDKKLTLANMSDEELTAHLYDIGYFEDEKLNDFTVRKMKIITKENGDRVLENYDLDIPTQKIGFRSENLSLNAVFGELKREKLL